VNFNQAEREVLGAYVERQQELGVDNIFDKSFQDHLGGYNRAENPDLVKRERLPGYGRNLFVRASYDF
jgi:outer membrane receptor protein involved in Fe transport